MWWFDLDRQRKTGEKILERLEEAGHEAYFVGGFVRDFLMGRKTKDIDITTSARPDEVKRLFPRSKETGAAFGTLTVLEGGFAFEVTTFRSEGRYDNHRHPREIAFSDSLEADLSRRDFTINQLVMDKDGRVKDIFGGREDLENGLIRTIGDARERFEEDALRMLRAFRFRAALGFSLEEETARAIEDKKHLIQEISIERIQDELLKLFAAPHARKALRTMLEVSFTKTLFDAEKAVALLAESRYRFDAVTAFALMAALDGLDIETWRFSKRFTKQVETVRSLHEATYQKGFTPLHVFQAGRRACERADRVNRLLGGANARETIRRIDRELPIRKRSDLAVKGGDIARAFKVKNPENIGRTHEALLRAVLAGRVENDKPSLLQEAARILEEKEGTD